MDLSSAVHGQVTELKPLCPTCRELVCECDALPTLEYFLEWYPGVGSEWKRYTEDDSLGDLHKPTGTMDDALGLYELRCEIDLRENDRDGPPKLSEHRLVSVDVDSGHVEVVKEYPAH